MKNEAKIAEIENKIASNEQVMLKCSHRKFLELCRENDALRAEIDSLFNA